MAWVHDTGYAPAYDHTGYPVSVLLDGAETGSSSARIESEVIGWRSACDCGWRGMQFYPRSEWPSASGLAPDDVDGWETGTAAFAEWQLHLARALPELAVHDLVRQIAELENRVRDAVQAARRTGLSWPDVGRAAGLTAHDARSRWGSAPAAPSPTARSWSSRSGRHHSF